MNYILYNPLADNFKGEEHLKAVTEELAERFPDLIAKDIVKMDTDAFIKELAEEDNVIITGGDGTINHFVNIVYGKGCKANFYYKYGGTGNDFARDIDPELKGELIPLNQYVQHLPLVTINGKIQLRFVNGIGFGVDGMAALVGEQKKAEGAKKINYTTISINLLLFHYKCPSGTITVDGESRSYKKIWLASAMQGRYYGGGMIAAPDQDRLSGKVTSCVWHDVGKIRALMNFPSIFKGTHVNKKKLVDMREGKVIEVHFNSPMALQVDGEVFKDVTDYKVEFTD